MTDTGALLSREELKELIKDWEILLEKEEIRIREAYKTWVNYLDTLCTESVDQYKEILGELTYFPEVVKKWFFFDKVVGHTIYYKGDLVGSTREVESVHDAVYKEHTSEEGIEEFVSELRSRVCHIVLLADSNPAPVLIVTSGYSSSITSNIANMIIRKHIRLEDLNKMFKDRHRKYFDTEYTHLKDLLSTRETVNEFYIDKKYLIPS